MGFGGELLSIIIRGWTFLWTLLALSLVGNAIAIQLFNNASVNYSMFTAAFAMLVLLVWIGSRFMALPWAVMCGLDAAAMFFSLIAGIVLAARLHVRSCDNIGYLITNGLVQGSEHRCRDLQASCAFFWFIFAGFLAAMLISFGDRGTTTFRSSKRSGSTPAMSQV